VRTDRSLTPLYPANYFIEIRHHIKGNFILTTMRQREGVIYQRQELYNFYA